VLICKKWRCAIKLTQKNILITGGMSGIGNALCNQLMEAGNQLTIITRRQANKGDNPREIYCDLANLESIQQLVKFLLEGKWMPDLLINCAAIQNTLKFNDQDFEIESIDLEVKVNFTSIALLTALFLPSLERQKESAVVNLTSGLALFPKTNSAIYSATKAALHSLSQSLRYQLENTGVKVFEAILPLVDTNMTKGRGKNKMSASDAARAILRGIEKDQYEMYIGKARYLPFLSRVSPGLVKNILKRF